MEDVVKTSKCSTELPMNVTLTCLALKRAHVALLLAFVEIQKLTVPVLAVWTTARLQTHTLDLGERMVDVVTGI